MEAWKGREGGREAGREGGVREKREVVNDTGNREDCKV